MLRVLALPQRASTEHSASSGACTSRLFCEKSTARTPQLDEESYLCVQALTAACLLAVLPTAAGRTTVGMQDGILYALVAPAAFTSKYAEHTLAGRFGVSAATMNATLQNTNQSEKTEEGSSRDKKILTGDNLALYFVTSPPLASEQLNL